MNGSSVIGRQTVVRGNVRGNGSLEILGRVEGDVSVTGELVLAEDSAVKGNVSGTHVTVSGAVQGDVRGSEAVLLERGARVIGDLTAPRIGVATGALVRGLVRTDGEPPLAAPRRPAVGARPAAPAFSARPPVAPPAAKVEPVREPPREPVRQAEEEVEVDEPVAEKPAKAGREAPPPPVVPALAKGAKAKKKKKED
jgi:cytoskeletal protein CcmA (bactofilin family)